MFGLPRLRRERWFETSWRGFELRTGCHDHTRPAITRRRARRAQTGAAGAGDTPTVARLAQAMGIDWMTRDELAQAIPPAYTEHIGRALLEHLAAREAA